FITNYLENVTRTCYYAFCVARVSLVMPNALESPMLSAGQDLLRFAEGRQFKPILADPPWQFTNKTGKVAPEHKRLSRYGTMKLDEIMGLPVAEIAATPAHLYLWCP